MYQNRVVYAELESDFVISKAIGIERKVLRAPEMAAVKTPPGFTQPLRLRIMNVHPLIEFGLRSCSALNLLIQAAVAP